MCVSTGKVAMPNACDNTTLAVLCPTPGSASSASISEGTTPPCRSINNRARRFDKWCAFGFPVPARTCE